MGWISAAAKETAGYVTIKNMDILDPDFPPLLWSVLDGRLWHATECIALTKIISDGEIRPNVGNRYNKSFCGLRGSVCLFDFGPTAHCSDVQYGNLYGWFGHQQNSRVAIWLEIDRTATKNSLLEARAARNQWNKTSCDKTFIPGVEACHHGPIPLDAVLSALLVASHDLEVFKHCKLQGISQQIKNFTLSLPPSSKDGIVEILSRKRNRSE